MTALQLIDWIEDMLDSFPSGIDKEADENDNCPEDMTAHIAGLIWQKIQQYKNRPAKPTPDKEGREPLTPQQAADEIWNRVGKDFADQGALDE